MIISINVVSYIFSNVSVCCCYYATCLFNVYYVCILVLHRVEPEAHHAWHHIAIPSLASQHHSITAFLQK